MKSFSAQDITAAHADQVRVLMFQGPSNWFFRDLGRALQGRGAKVHRVGFCPGDRLFWARNAGGFTLCDVAAKEFPAWIASFLETFRATDILMLGDGRFYHRHTIEAAHRLNMVPRIHIVEHGMIRPDWLLVDPDGLGQNSRIIERFGTAPARKPQPSIPAPGASFWQYAAMDIAYHVPGMLWGRLYNKHYQRPGVVSQWEEYAGWIRKLLAQTRSSKFDRAALGKLDKGAGPQFLFPLQLETDFQIREHGKGKTLRTHLEDTLKSFAAFAPSDACLLIKRHPLDNGRTPWRQVVSKLARGLGLQSRVHYFDGGELDHMMALCDGVVTINSTVGLQAILSGLPCCTLGFAVYDIVGLTAQSGLDQFWTSPEPPNSAKAEDFRAFLLSECHVPGSFDGPGAAVGIQSLAARIVA